MSGPGAKGLTVIILTFNEAQHIERCIRSIQQVAARIVLVDSGSTDETVDIAKRLGAEVFCHSWINHSVQVNWAIDHAKINTPWVMRLDADEVLVEGMGGILLDALRTAPAEVDAISVRRRIYFLGHWIRWGGIYPIYVLRVWRNGAGRCESRWMDEHIITQGQKRLLAADIADINNNSIDWWTAKHNRYATLEAMEELLSRQDSMPVERLGLDRTAKVKRWIKTAVYWRLPIGVRAAAYFFYRYILRLGFLDGPRGFVFHFLQGFWYRLLVDVKLWELSSAKRAGRLSSVLKERYGVDMSSDSRLHE